MQLTNIDVTARTRDLFLRLIGLIYMFAFGSIYLQIPGLYGNSGILPVRSLMQTIMEENKGKSAESLFMNTPTLLWFIKLDPDVGLELLAVLGVLFSFLCIVAQRARVMPMFVILWILYLSIYKVGETFLWFQWDILLLEAGFITLFVTPLSNKQSDVYTGVSSHREIPFFLVKWLLFRLMFASGVVKLTSKCPTWWGLTALNHHYESQCIPTPLAWWAHQLPEYVQQFSVISTYVIEMGLPFLFFSPYRLHRLFAAYGQILLMILIYLSGNYNFFNLLTAVFCLSLFDDEHLEFLKNCLTFGCFKSKPEMILPAPKHSSKTKLLLRFAANLFVLGIFCYGISKLFGYDKGEFSIKILPAEFDNFLKWMMPYVIGLGVLGFIIASLRVLWRNVITTPYGIQGSFKGLIKFLLVLCPSVYILTISMVPFSQIEPTFRGKLWPIANNWYRSTMKFEVAHSYGLFRRMTGVGGRPEVIIEGSNTENEHWKEYHFVYKPGKTTAPLTWAAPHQPRLDWQMWFAALDSYHRNPWIISLMHGLLRGERDVLKLIDQPKNPFPSKPPKYMRAVLYHYHYTRITRNGNIPKAWWKREFKSIYVPTISRDDTTVLEFLKYHKLSPPEHLKVKAVSTTFGSFSQKLRRFTELLPPHYLLWSLAVAAFCISSVGTFLPNPAGKKVDFE